MTRDLNQIAAETPEWALVCDTGALVSEGPVWNTEDGCLYWVDVYGPSLNRIDPETKDTRSWSLPCRIGSFALRPRGALVALKTGLYDLDFASGEIVPRFAAPYDSTEFYFNDGRADAMGRFWVGVSHGPNSRTKGKGWFHRVDAQGLDAQLEGVTIANGIAFSPDNKTLYTAESRESVILAYDYDLERGQASGRRVFATVPGEGKPDGAAVDEDGGYWTALIGSGRLLRYAPDGSLDRMVQTPTRFPTMVAFGGADLSTAYITSSRKYLDRLAPEERALETNAGGIWRCRLGVRGMPEPRLSF